MYIDEMVDKDGNIWGPGAWPDLVTKHFVDFCKAPEVEIMAEKRELANLSNAAMKHGGHSRTGNAPATLEMALELTERTSKPEEYDEHLVTSVDGSCIPCNGCKGKTPRYGGRQKSKKQKTAGVLDGRRFGWAATQGDRVGGVVGRPRHLRE